MAKFDCATWRPVGNHGGPMAENIGLLLHHAVANGSLHDWFNNVNSQVSAHFWVSQDGVIEQYVDTDVIAWHAMQMNPSYCGVETEGCAEPPYAEPMSDKMVDALARLYAEGHKRHGWENRLANADGQYGFGYHRMGVATGCPCEERLQMRPVILQKAFGQPTTNPPKVEPKPPGKVPPLHVDYFGMTHHPTCADVRVWQQKMHERGWVISVDQEYGSQSQSVCLEFQKEKKLYIDGLVGPDTWEATWTAPVT